MSSPLFTTVVGAHIWKMEHAGSDIDLFMCYLEPTTKILNGTASRRSTFDQEVEENGEVKVDVARHELQTVVEQLLKGNINFTFGVMSPIVQETSNIHQSLVELIRLHPYKNLYHSMKGMAVHNYKLYEREGKLDNPKKVNGILRVLQLGCIYLDTGKLHFEPYHNGTRSEIEPAIARLDKAYKESKLEEKIPEDKLRDILLEARFNNLADEWWYKI